MDLQHYLQYLDVVRRRWVTFTVVGLVTIAVASGVTLAMTPKYTATTRLFFSVDAGGGSLTDLAQGTSFAEKQMTSYAQVATSPLVLDPVVERLQLDMSSTDLADVVTATIPPETLILDISVTVSGAEAAALIANEVGDQLRAATETLAPKRSNGDETVKATKLSAAVVPQQPSSPNVARNLALGMILGLLLGLGVALLRHVLDTRVRSDQDVRGVTESPLLGVIGFDEKVPDHPVILRDEPLGAAAEAIRRLRTNFQFLDLADRPRSIVITSSVPGEGKSTTSLNLAVALADAGSRVILVDADLRRPSVANSLGLEGQVGLTTVLIGRADVADVIQRVPDTTLDVLPSGRIPPNPSELLGSGAMERLLAELTASYDVVLLDTPPLLPVTDAAVLSNLTGGALMVVGADRVHRPQLREAIASLTTAGVHLHGVVLNRIARQEAGYYVYDSGYSPREEPAKEPAAPPIVARSKEPTASQQPAVTAPKRARVEPTRPVPNPAADSSGSLAPTAGGSHVNGTGKPAPVALGSRVNGSEPPPVRRATPVGR